MKNQYLRKPLAIFALILFSILLVASDEAQNMFRKVNDFDGDGKADFAITRNIDGLRYWYVLQSTNGFNVFQWGIETDENAAGDFDGDGKTDPAIFRQELIVSEIKKYAFWSNGSQTGVRNFTFTTNNYPNVSAYQQDYDGDGKTEISWNINDNERYLVVYSDDSFIPANNPGGANATFIKIGDTDGDGKADAAAFNPGNSLVSIKKSLSDTTQTLNFGTSGDEFVMADFDGDGKGDIAIFRQSDGTWWWMRSSDNVISAATFGTLGDIPIPADYDGDGKSDLAIWRSGEQSYYWVYGSQVGVFAVAWGISGDSVVRY